MKEYIVSKDSYAYEMRRYDELTELIRCKDCKWWSADTCMEWYDTPYTPADGYCFRAERKEQ